MALAGARWLQVPNWELTTAWEIDSYSDYLVGFIQELISQTVPYKAPSTHAQAWWTPQVSEAITTERKARRQWSHNRTEHNWDDYVTALKAKRQRIASAKQAHWRKSVHEAAVSPEGIWKLAKWARTKSHLPPEPPKMPELQWQGSWHSTVQDKAQALSERFYPVTEADLEDITDKEFQEDLYGPTLEMNQLVTSAEVQAIVRKIKPDKCPGTDEIPNRFLQAMGVPLVRALQALITAVFKVNYFPERFRAARTIVLR
jgi:hypothetical protein